MKEEKALYNIYAVLDGKPLTRVNQRRLNWHAANSKVAKLLSEGAGRAYAVKG